MSQGKIVSHLGEGLYNVLLYNDITNIDDQIDRINELITRNDAMIIIKQDEISGVEAKLTPIIILYNDLIESFRVCLVTNDYDEENCVTERENVETVQVNSLVLTTQLATAKEELESLEILEKRFDDELLALNNNIPPAQESINVWCADLADGIEDDVIPTNTMVQLIDIYSFQKQQYEHWVPPATHGRSPAWTGDDKMAPSLSSDKNGFIYNFNMIGPVMAWNPPYRLATITALDEELHIADVAYHDLTDKWGANYNGNEPTENISIDYMNYGGLAFDVGDAVIVSFCKTQMSDPLIIGFYSNPATGILRLEPVKQTTEWDVTELKYSQFDFTKEKLRSAKGQYSNAGYKIASQFMTIGDSVVVIHGGVTFLNFPTIPRFPVNDVGSIDCSILAYRIELNGVPKKTISVPSGSDQYMGGFHLYGTESNPLMSYYLLFFTTGQITLNKRVHDFVADTDTFVASDTLVHVAIVIPPVQAIPSTTDEMRVVTEWEVFSAIVSGSNMVTNRAGTSTVYAYNNALPPTDSFPSVTALEIEITDTEGGSSPSISVTKEISQSATNTENTITQMMAYDYIDDTVNTIKTVSNYNSGLTIMTGFLFNDQIIENAHQVDFWGQLPDDIPYSKMHLAVVSLAGRVFHSRRDKDDPPINDGYTVNYGSPRIWEFWEDTVRVDTGPISLQPGSTVLWGDDTCLAKVLVNRVDIKYLLNGEWLSSKKDVDDLNLFTMARLGGPDHLVINIKLVSDNATDDSYAIEGDTLTLTFDQTEDIDPPLVSILGNSVTANLIGDEYTAVYVIQNGDGNGDATFIIDADTGEPDDIDIFTKTSGVGRCSGAIVDTIKPFPTLSNTPMVRAIIAGTESDPQYQTQPFVLVIEWNEKILEFTQDDIGITSGVIVWFKIDSPNKTYSMKVRPDLTTTSVGIEIAVDVVSDKAGNLNIVFNDTIFGVFE